MKYRQTVFIERVGSYLLCISRDTDRQEGAPVDEMENCKLIATALILKPDAWVS